MEKDYRSTSECHFSMAKDTFWPLPTFMALAKGSPNTESFSRGYYIFAQNKNKTKLLFYLLSRILRLKEAGLIDKWVSLYIPKDTKCSSKQKNNGNKGKKEEPYKPLSLSNLNGTFIVLLTGYSLAFVILLVEKYRYAIYIYVAFIIDYYF